MFYHCVKSDGSTVLIPIFPEDIIKNKLSSFLVLRIFLCSSFIFSFEHLKDGLAWIQDKTENTPTSEGRRDKNKQWIPTWLNQHNWHWEMCWRPGEYMMIVSRFNGASLQPLSPVPPSHPITTHIHYPYSDSMGAFDFYFLISQCWYGNRWCFILSRSCSQSARSCDIFDFIRDEI